MQTVNVREARQRIGKLLDQVVAGEEVVIMRRGRPVARLTRIEGDEAPLMRFPDRADLRAKLPAGKKTSTKIIREIRDERY